jgi:hypothetical protein
MKLRPLVGGQPAGETRYSVAGASSPTGAIAGLAHTGKTTTATISPTAKMPSDHQKRGRVAADAGGGKTALPDMGRCEGSGRTREQGAEQRGADGASSRTRKSSLAGPPTAPAGNDQ